MLTIILIMMIFISIYIIIKNIISIIKEDNEETQYDFHIL